MLLAEGRRAVTVASAVPYTAVDATGTTFKLPKGALTLRPDLELPTEAGPLKAVSPLVVRPAKKALLTLDGRAYRGKLELVVQGGFLRVVNVVGARELPPGRRRRRGAVQLAGRGAEGAGRRSALVRAGKPREGQAVRPLLGRAQPGLPRRRGRESIDVEGGHATRPAKSCSTAARSRRRYYFSTSGGKTASAADVFGSTFRISCRDRIRGTRPRRTTAGARSCSARERCRRSSAWTHASSTRRRRPRRPVASARSSSRRPTGPETVPASLVRTALGLRSTWITVGVLRLDRPRAAPP